jgi:uncharacterized protein YaaN involved in tellurite resistance
MAYDIFGGGNTTTHTMLAADKPNMSNITFAQTPTTAIQKSNAGKYLTAIRSTPTADISKIGSDTGVKISAMSRQVLDKVKAADSGEFGTGMKKILDLTSGVKLDQLGEQSGFMSKIRGFLTSAKNNVTHQIDSVQDEIDRVAGGLKTAVKRMEDEAIWLGGAREANEEHEREYEALYADLQIALEEERDILNSMPQDDVQAVSDQRARVERLERHTNKIFKLIHLTKLTTPEICGLQIANVNLVEKFNDLIDVTVPAWGKQVSLALIGMRQAKDAQIAQDVDDKTNEFFIKAANMVHDTTIKSAQLLAQDSIKTETLVHMQNQIIDMVKNVNQIDAEAKKRREETVKSVSKLDVELKQAMLGS